MVSSLNSKIHLWSWQDSEIVREFQGHKNIEHIIDAQIFDFQDTTLLISGSEDGRIVIWDLKTQ